MTEPSQYFKGRTVQEQMDEVIGYVDTRAAEVATTAIASDVAQVHQDMLDADADASAAAASAAAAAGTLANAVKKTGESFQLIEGNVTVNGNLTGATVICGMPATNSEATPKQYVDQQDALKISITDINQYAVGLTGNQLVAGTKTFEVKQNLPNIGKQSNNIYLNPEYTWNELIRFINVATTSTIVIDITGSTSTNPSICYGKILIKMVNDTTVVGIWLMRKNYTSNGFFADPTKFVLTLSDNTISLFTSLPSLRLNVTVESNIIQGVPQNPNNSLIWDEIQNRVHTNTLTNPVSIVDPEY